MAQVTKTREQAAAEEKDALKLSERIIAATDRIPYHVLNGSQQTAAAFKRDAHKARTQATDRMAKKNLVKMLVAWNLISGYYKGLK